MFLNLIFVLKKNLCKLVFYIFVLKGEKSSNSNLFYLKRIIFSLIHAKLLRNYMYLQRSSEPKHQIFYSILFNLYGFFGFLSMIIISIMSQTRAWGQKNALINHITIIRLISGVPQGKVCQVLNQQIFCLALYVLQLDFYW